MRVWGCEGLRAWGLEVRTALALLLMPVVLGACVQLAQPAPDLRSYRLDYTAPVTNFAPLPVVLRIAPFGIDAIYDREPIVFREDAYSTGIYHYHQWSSPPASMIAELLARDLTASGTYASVVSGPSTEPPDYQLDGYVELIEERGKSHDCHAVLRLRTSLFRLHPTAKNDAVAMHKTYDAEMPTPCNEPRALAASMSQGLEQISTQMQTDVRASIDRDLAMVDRKNTRTKSPDRKR